MACVCVLCICVYVCICVCVCLHVLLRLCVFVVCLCVSVFARVCVRAVPLRVSVCENKDYTYTVTRTHTHTHTHTEPASQLWSVCFRITQTYGNRVPSLCLPIHLPNQLLQLLQLLLLATAVHLGTCLNNTLPRAHHQPQGCWEPSGVNHGTQTMMVYNRWKASQGRKVGGGW